MRLKSSELRFLKGRPSAEISKDLAFVKQFKANIPTQYQFERGAATLAAKLFNSEFAEQVNYARLTSYDCFADAWRILVSDFPQVAALVSEAETELGEDLSEMQRTFAVSWAFGGGRDFDNIEFDWRVFLM